MQAQHLYERIESRTLLLALRTIEPRDAPGHYGHFDRLPCRGSLSCWGRDAGKVRGGDAGVVVDEAYRGNQWVCGRGHGLRLYVVITTATNTSMLALAEGKLGLKGEGVLKDHEFADAAGEMYYGLTAAEGNHIEKNKNML
ncbi:hypothetical protein MHUMG1_04724 [Metarhizium humberi]|uniref:Uncharacterized protein n=1 Tax=Metarhizium humberi TaxID=2596975 RepID=A0A9P8S7W8_9HYPO|nr:hypothetical protein MHUMG1_04724 [Metarhizium humberi]